MTDNSIIWEYHNENNIWKAFGNIISNYIEQHLHLNVNTCDYSDGTDFFRIYFHGMFLQDLRTTYVRKIRRNDLKKENKTNYKEQVRELTNWEIISPSNIEKEETCPICLCDLIDEDDNMDDDNDIVHLNECGNHYFHSLCITQCYSPPFELDINKGHLKCPICSHIYGIKTGTMPLGFMKLSKHQQSLPTYKCGTIQIVYSFPSGIQGPEHPNPGQKYSGTVRNCFLPDDEEGRIVLKKLDIAFKRRLTFIIGTSITSGRTNTVVWNGIHHKTNIKGGPSRYGYPDPTYLQRVSSELASVGVI